MLRRLSAQYLRPARNTLLAVLLATPSVVCADGFVVDRVYSPYVNPIEREIELRAVLVENDDPSIDDAQVYRLGFAQAFAERFKAEFYLVGADSPGNDLSLSAYELELKWQLTEQGEYFVDWGLLFELESVREMDLQEFSTSALIAKELGQWTGTINLALVYEWGKDIQDELETQLAAQLRYRYLMQFEPAVELYAGQAAKGMGPVGVGQFRLGAGKKLRWELGVIFGLDSTSPNEAYRAMLEYEF
jgi:hypothetical protein